MATFVPLMPNITSGLSGLSGVALWSILGEARPPINHDRLEAHPTTAHFTMPIPIFVDRPKHPNGQLPTPPASQIGPWVYYYYCMGMTDQVILDTLKAKRLYDPEKYTYSLKTLRRDRAAWGLDKARGQRWTVETIGPHLEPAIESMPKAGANTLKFYLRRQHQIFVARDVILAYLRNYHPQDLANRRRRLRAPRRFFALGVNDIWCFDQHDKWLRFRVFLHVGLEPVSGKVLWLKAWWTAKNPRRICKYYLDAIIENNGIPLITQSDPGTENFNIAHAQSLMRQKLDPNLGLSLQHNWKRNKTNVKPEIFWSYLRRIWSPGYEDVMEIGLTSQIYNPDDPVQRSVFHYLFIPWLQEELDKFRDVYNTRTKRRDPRSLLPRGMPNHIFDSPSQFGVQDLKIEVPPDLIGEVRGIYAPADHSVHELVHPELKAFLDNLYLVIGAPNIDRNSIWGIYGQLLTGLVQAADFDTTIAGQVLADDEEQQPGIDALQPELDDEGHDSLNKGGRVGYSESDDEDDVEAIGYFTDEE